MENKRQTNKNKGNQSARPQRPQRQRPRRVVVDREVEVVVQSNTTSRIYYDNPRMNVVIDLFQIGDTDYLTVGDLRTILNSNRSLIEGFELIITEVMDDAYTVEDVLIFLGLDKKYEEYYSLAKKKSGEPAEYIDIKNFILKAPEKVFEKNMEEMSEKLRSRVVETAVVLFKRKVFSDYNKMEIIERYVNDELFADARETELDDNIAI
jgi:hypothetical protein